MTAPDAQPAKDSSEDADATTTGKPSEPRVGGLPEVLPAIGIYLLHKLIGHPAKDIVKPETRIFSYTYCKTCGAWL